MSYQSYESGFSYYIGHAFPLTFLFGLLFFLIGLLIGFLLWRNYRAKAELVESENARLRDQQAILRQQIQEAGGKV